MAKISEDILQSSAVRYVLSRLPVQCTVPILNILTDLPLLQLRVSAVTVLM